MPSLIQRALLLVGLGFFATAAALAAEPFTRQLTTEEFASAGLEKLSASERAQLDALIRKHETGELARARTDAAKAETARLAAENKAERIAAQAPKPIPEKKEGWLKKITLNPGTSIQYETIETQIVGNFSGFRVGTVFQMANGQRWRVTSGDYPAPREAGPKPVKIVPGMLGSFFLEIDGVRTRPKAVFAGSVE